MFCRTKTFTVTVTSTRATSTASTTVTVTGPAGQAATTSTSTSTTTSTPTVTAIATLMFADTTTSTSTVTITTGLSNQKRDLPAVRATTPACPVTSTAQAAAIPAFASDCTGTRFSSVCSCNGNSPTPVTLATPTSQVIRTSTVSTTATVTSTRTSTVTPINTATSTVILTITAIAAPVTTTQTISSTATMTATAATTTTVAPDCSDAQYSQCRSDTNGCRYCGVYPSNGQAACLSFTSGAGCNVDADCTRTVVMYPGPFVCAYYLGSKCCVQVTDNDGAQCRSPSQQVKRMLGAWRVVVE